MIRFTHQSINATIIGSNIGSQLRNLNDQPPPSQDGERCQQLFKYSGTRAFAYAKAQSLASIAATWDCQLDVTSQLCIASKEVRRESITTFRAALDTPASALSECSSARSSSVPCPARHRECRKMEMGTSMVWPGLQSEIHAQARWLEHGCASLVSTVIRCSLHAQDQGVPTRGGPAMSNPGPPRLKIGT